MLAKLVRLGRDARHTTSFQTELRLSCAVLVAAIEGLAGKEISSQVAFRSLSSGRQGSVRGLAATSTRLVLLATW